MPSTSSDRVLSLLARLRTSLGSRGTVIDEALRARIAAAHEESGMEPEARLRVAFGPPASPERIRALVEACKATLGVTLPADYIAFLEANDGMCLQESADGSDDDAAFDEPYFGADALMSVADILDFLERARVEVTHQDGSVEVTSIGRAPKGEDSANDVRFVPFYALGDVGYHAIGFSAEGPPVISIVDVDHERMWEAEGHERLTTTFADWIDAFVKAGLEPFATSKLLQTD